MSPAITSKIRLAAAVLAGLLLGATGLTACSGQDQGRSESPVAVVEANNGFNGTLIDPPLRPANVVLKDTHGTQFNLARLAPDKVTALFFGFTNCDDVCPTTMADLASARRSLPPSLAGKVTVLFVTVDPIETRPRCSRGGWVSSTPTSSVFADQPNWSIRLNDPFTSQRAATHHRQQTTTRVVTTGHRSMTPITRWTTPAPYMSLAPATGLFCTPVARLHTSTPKTSLACS